MCPVNAHTSGAAWASSPPSRYTVARDASSSATSNAAGPGAAAAAAAGWASQPSAGMTVEVIDVRVREFVPTNWATSTSNAFSGDCAAAGR